MIVRIGALKAIHMLEWIFMLIVHELVMPPEVHWSKAGSQAWMQIASMCMRIER